MTEKKKGTTASWKCFTERSLVRAELLYHEDFKKVELVVVYDFDTAKSEIWSKAINAMRYVRSDELLKEELSALRSELELFKISSVSSAIEDFEDIARQVENHVPKFMLESLIEDQTKIEISFIDHKAVASPHYQHIRMTYRTMLVDQDKKFIWS